MVSTLAIQVILLLLALGSAQTPQQPVQTTRSPHGALNIPCQNCHTFSGWKPIRSAPEFDHNRTKYPLRGMHRSVACQQCHVNPVFTNVGNKCADCHADIHRRQMGAQCEQCHSVNGWMTSLQSVRQHQNRFPLIGAHAVTDCDSCHKGAAAGQFKGFSTDCISCHMNSYASTKSPSHVMLRFPTQCQQCHTTMDSWSGARFDHASFTGFALTGAHARLDCASCHAGGRYQGTSANCIGCHAKDFNGAKDPDHVKLGFPQTCSQCHNSNSWAGARFDHNTLTAFPLTGAHTTVSCSQCHVNGRYAGTAKDCVSCHLSDFQKTTNPNHVSAGFPTTCTQCHTTAGWAGANFNHGLTQFPLTGAHTSVACTQCHLNGKYTGTAKDCASCHLANFQRTTNPNHVSAGFPTTCVQCHNTTSWAGAKFDHGMTAFPLTGAHASAACTQCHVNGKYAGTAKDCASCHLANYQRTTNPNHVSAGFPTTCSQCHNTTAWAGAKFDHNATGFPLTGTHATVACTQCHVNGKYAGTSKDCASCHLANYQKTTNPNHVAAGFPTTCSICHGTIKWAGARFDHNTLTTFPLTGTHATTACTQCHVNGRYAGTPKTCNSCHLTDYQKTTNPNHTAVGFPTDCSICHSTTNWQGAKFDHATTGFPLTGVHTTQACSSCHTSAAAPNPACVSCHLKNYNSTTNPNHVMAGFPQQCNVCHTTTGWQPSTFNHNNTAFPLTGAMTNVPCASCHINGKYAGTPTDCYSCHKAVYQSVTNPNHIAAGFPTTCLTCHTTSSWTGATFNHTWFRIPHNTARLCSDCHTNPSNYTVFLCTGCHTQATTTAKHSGVNGFVWNSTNCYSCHKNAGN